MKKVEHNKQYEVKKDKIHERGNSLIKNKQKYQLKRGKWS